MSLTTDKKDPGLNKEKNNGQNETYLVLSDEEKDKGFVRPVRNTYMHKGRYYALAPTVFDKPEKSEINGKIYVATIPALVDEDGKVIGRAYITQKELDQYNKTEGYVGGCNTATTMADSISETYARDPKFYGSTFCMGCGTHLPITEFVWDGTDEKVGS